MSEPNKTDRQAINDFIRGVVTNRREPSAEAIKAALDSAKEAGSEMTPGRILLNEQIRAASEPRNRWAPKAQETPPPAPKPQETPPPKADPPPDPALGGVGDE